MPYIHNLPMHEGERSTATSATNRTTSVSAAPIVTPNVNILVSTDIMAIDQASVDMVCVMKPEESRDLTERMTSRHGLRHVSYMKALGIGHNRYMLINLDHSGRRMTVHEAVENLTPLASQGSHEAAPRWPHTCEGPAPQDLREGYQFASSLEVMISVGYTGVAVQENAGGVAEWIPRWAARWVAGRFSA